jgi:tagaturonate reductase
VFDEILPSIPTPEAAKRARAKAELETLRDAVEGGELLPLTVNSVSQWRVGLLPSLLDYRRSRGTVAPALALSLAALISFHRARPAADDGFEGVRAGRRYPIRDEATVLIADAWASFDVNEDWYAFAYGVLGEVDLWGEELNRIPALVGTIAQDLAMIATSGARAAVASLNSQQR